MSGRLLAAVLAAFVALGACGNQSDGDTAVPATEPPSTDPTIVGFITDIAPFEPVTEGCVQPDPDADPDAPVSSDDSPFCTDLKTTPLGTVLVEEDPTTATGDNKISFTIGRDAILLTDSSGSHGAFVRRPGRWDESQGVGRRSDHGVVSSASDGGRDRGRSQLICSELVSRGRVRRRFGIASWWRLLASSA
jgi:hypothetical protein